MQLVCTQKSNGSEKNSSTITWTLSTIGGSSNYSTGPTEVVINGTTVYSKDRVNYDTNAFPAAKGSTDGTITIPHNSDGTKSITVKFSTAIYTKTVTEYSKSWTLTSIPQYAKILTHEIKGRTETTATVTWGCDSACDIVQYSVNGGAWTTPTGTNFPDYVISGLSPNTTYKIKTRVRRKDSQLYTES